MDDDTRYKILKLKSNQAIIKISGDFQLHSKKIIGLIID